MSRMSTDSPKPHPRAVELAPDPAPSGESAPNLFSAERSSSGVGGANDDWAVAFRVVWARFTTLESSRRSTAR